MILFEYILKNIYRITRDFEGTQCMMDTLILSGGASEMKSGKLIAG
jgi:hypothetical protein